MYHLAKSIYLWATSKEEYSILLLGLDNAGKTTLLTTLKALYAPSPTPPPQTPTLPTVGQNVATIALDDMYLKIWDVGGQHALRSMWTTYFTVCHCIIFVIDGCDIGSPSPSLSPSEEEDTNTTTTGRLEECRRTLESVLLHPSTTGVPLLVLANKQDREDCVETVRIKEGLVRGVFEGEGLAPRDSRVLPVSALKGEGVGEAVEWVRARVRWNREGREPVMR